MACKDPTKYFPIRKTPMLLQDALQGKVAFITGGGTGLGKAMAKMFAKLGATVVIASRRMDVLQETADEIMRKTSSARVIPVQMDVRSASDIERCADEVQSKVGLPHIIVNNAAGNFIMATERLSSNAFKTIVDIVLLGTANVTIEFGKRLIKAKQGCTFLSITAAYARSGGAFVVPSAAAKAGVENMTKSLANEWGKYGMRFISISPGPIMTKGAFDRLNPGSMQNAEQGVKSTIGAGRVGEDAELANLAAYVVSDYATWLSGAIIDFDGGQHVMQNGSSLTSSLHLNTQEDWANIESLIRQRTGKEKKAKL